MSEIRVLKIALQHRFLKTPDVHLLLLPMTHGPMVGLYDSTKTKNKFTIFSKNQAGRLHDSSGGRLTGATAARIFMHGRPSGEISRIKIS